MDRKQIALLFLEIDNIGLVLPYLLLPPSKAKYPVCFQACMWADVSVCLQTFPRHIVDQQVSSINMQLLKSVFCVLIV